MVNEKRKKGEQREGGKKEARDGEREEGGKEEKAGKKSRSFTIQCSKAAESRIRVTEASSVIAVDPQVSLG